MLRTVALAVCALLLACKGPESGDTMTLGTGEGSSSSGSVTTVNPTTDPTTGSTGAGGSSGTTEAATTTGTTGAATGTTGEVSASSSSGSSSTGGGGACTPLDCGGMVYACGDCMDNDGDGKTDLADPECVSPCDDLEDTFATGLPGDNMDPCKQDCFFDGNSGGGKGDCAWDLKCDPKGPGGDKCPYDPKAMCADMQSQECVDGCQVPNGCDCFGCCSVEVDGVAYDVYLGDPDCSLANIDTCSQCTKNADCDDPCDPQMCEVCFGQTEPPPGCDSSSCDPGVTPCTIDMMGNSDCPEGFYCSTGCCYMIEPG